MSPVSRRGFVGSVAFAALFHSNASLPQPSQLEEVQPPLPKKYKSLADEEPMNQEFGDILSGQGTLKPTSDEVVTAQKITDAAPKNTRPVEVATFLLTVAQGQYGEDWRPFTRAWPKDAPANPLILSFFQKTKTKPEGDTTAWCAAFVNWCLFTARGDPYPMGFTQPTKSAASGSFRNWGKTGITFDALTNSFSGDARPKQGDLAVFEGIREDGSPDPYLGHVAFFLDMDADTVTVLGGNQFEGKPVIHAINVKKIAKRGKLRLHSIRSDPGLQLDA